MENNLIKLSHSSMIIQNSKTYFLNIAYDKIK